MFERMQKNILKSINELQQIQTALESGKNDGVSEVPVDSQMIRPMSKIQKGNIQDIKMTSLEMQISKIINGIFS